jgi:hypothetical protein
MKPRNNTKEHEKESIIRASSCYFVVYSSLSLFLCKAHSYCFDVKAVCFTVIVNYRPAKVNR